MARANKKTLAVSSSTAVLVGGLADGKNVLHIANVGDSACLIIRNGRLLTRTVSQTDGRNCPYQVCNDVAWRPLGRCTDIGQVLKVAVQLGDIVVCATDGFWDSVTAEQVVKVSSSVIRDGASPQSLADVLLILSREGWKPDDTTIVVSLVVNDLMVQMADEHVWVSKFLRFFPGIAKSYMRDRSIFYVQRMLWKLLNTRAETGLDDEALEFRLTVDLGQMRSSCHTGVKKSSSEMADLELPAEVKQLLDDYACGKLKLAKFKDTDLVSCEIDKPNLLLSHLPSGLNIETRELESHLETGNPVMLAGGQGSGKTRLLYTYLCSDKGGGGLYFTARRAEEHWGSADLDYLINEVLSSLRPIRPYGRSTDSILGNSGRSHGVTPILKLLLGARMKIYDYCKDKMSNTQWLLLQAACRALVDSNGVPVGEAGDVFKTFLANLYEHDNERKLLREQLVSRVSKMSTIPICVVDDVEQSRMALHGCFSESEDLVGLGFARVLGDFFQELDSRVIFSGASVDPVLLEKQARYGESPRIAQVFTKGCWNNANEAIQYAEKTLGCEKADADFVRAFVFERFKGRFTLFVTMLEVMLAKGLNLRDAAEYVERGYTTDEGVPEVTANFYKRIANSLQPCQAFIGWSAFEQSVFGAQPRVLQNERHCRFNLVNELLESGLTRLADDHALAGAVICDEYLVQKAYQNMHGVMSVHWMHPVMPKAHLPPGAESMADYDLVPFCILNEYKGVLKDMPVFMELLQAEDCPLQLKNLSKSQSSFLVNDGMPVRKKLKLDKFDGVRVYVVVC